MAAADLEPLSMDTFQKVAVHNANGFSNGFLAKLLSIGVGTLERSLARTRKRKFSLGQLLASGLHTAHFSIHDYQTWLRKQLIKFGVAEYGNAADQICDSVFPPELLSHGSVKQHLSQVLLELVIDIFANPPDDGYYLDWSKQELAWKGMLARIRCLADRARTTPNYGSIIGDRTVLQASGTYWAVTADRCTDDLVSGALPVKRRLALPFMPMAAGKWGFVDSMLWTNQHVMDWVGSLLGWSVDDTVVPVVLQLDQCERPQCVQATLAAQLTGALRKPPVLLWLFCRSLGALDEPVSFGSERLLVALLDKRAVCQVRDGPVNKRGATLVRNAAILFLRWSRITSVPPETSNDAQAAPSVSAIRLDAADAESHVPAARGASGTSNKLRRLQIIGE